jgi:hypothetical protein
LIVEVRIIVSSSTYICNGCQRVLAFDDYPPVGDLSHGFTCPECSKLAKKIAAEILARITKCGKDGEMAVDYYTHKLTPIQLSEKYGCTVEQALCRVELCIGYISDEWPKDIAYNDWLRLQT